MRTQSSGYSSWSGVTDSTKGRIHWRRPTAILHFSLATLRRTIHTEKRDFSGLGFLLKHGLKHRRAITTTKCGFSVPKLRNSRAIFWTKLGSINLDRPLTGMYLTGMEISGAKLIDGSSCLLFCRLRDPIKPAQVRIQFGGGLLGVARLHCIFRGVHFTVDVRQRLVQSARIPFCFQFVHLFRGAFHIFGGHQLERILGHCLVRLQIRGGGLLRGWQGGRESEKHRTNCDRQKCVFQEASCQHVYSPLVFVRDFRFGSMSTASYSRSCTLYNEFRRAEQAPGA